MNDTDVEELTVTVRDVMTPVVHHVAATATVAEAARTMVERNIHRLVVIQNARPSSTGARSMRRTRAGSRTV